jgi:hypothetical protein
MDMLLKLHGDASPELLPLLSSMMELLVAQERWADALRVVQHSIRIRTETGRVHSHEALVDEFWVQLLTNPEGVVERAADLADHLEREFGPLHPETAAGQSVLAMFLRHTGDIDQARARLLRAVEINRAIFGPQHYRVATGVLDLAAVAAMSGDAVAFELQFREALGIVTAAPEGELDSYVRMSRLDSVLLDIAVDDRSRPVVRKVLDIVRDASADESMVTFILPLLIRAERRAGDTLLAAGRSAEALAEYQYGLELARLTVDTQLDDAELLVRLGFLTAMDGDPDGSAETFREAMRCMVDGHILEPIWALIAQCGLIVSVTGGWTAVRPVLDALFDEAKEAGVMTEFRPEIVAAVPDGWFVKGSTTLLAPDGQANVIASSEPLDPSIDSEQYATVQQELLKKEFPEFALKSFERVTVLGDREGYVSTFEWTPPDSQRIAQAQLYYAENGRGYTATATTPAINLTALEPILHEVLRGLRLERNSTGG